MKCPKEGCEVVDETEFGIGSARVVTSYYGTGAIDRYYYWQLHFLMNPNHKPKE